MKIEYIPYQSYQISQYCAGRTMKNAAESATWSPRRVGVRVTNSRNAAKDANPNKTITPVGPMAKATAMNATMIHQALILAFRFSIVGNVGVPRNRRCKP